MVAPKQIASINTLPSSLNDAERKLNLKAIVPSTGQVREVEAFTATGVSNVWQEIITGSNSTFDFLRMARLNVSASSQEKFTRTLEKEEAVYYVNAGSASIMVDAETFQVTKGDVVYVSIDSTVHFSINDSADISEYKAIKCHTKYPNRLIRHEDIMGTPLEANLGKKRVMSERTVWKLIDKNIEANRLLFGDTYMAQRGAVGSYPPHFHGPVGPHGLGEFAKEEIYHFRCESDIVDDIPYVLQNCARPEEKINAYVHIFDDVAINVTPSYHDTIAPPSVDFMFCWCLASFTEGHRDWSEIYNKPGFENEW
jgi:4-deoxy-L-threo-5-hexosulose-uronate ketol-isomerase